MSTFILESRDEDEIICIMKNTLSTEEQNMFIMNFKGYLKYGTDDSAFVIDLDDVWEWIGFSTKGNCKRLLLNQFVEHEDFIVTEQSQKNENIMMSVKTFKKMCMRAGTKRADEVCDYYLKMENITNTYICNMLQKSNTFATEAKLKFIEAKHETEVITHKMLIRMFTNKPVVYVMKIMINPDGSFIIKIGRSNEVQFRYQKISSEFKMPVMISEIFECEMNHEFETFVHNHNKMQSLKCPSFTNGDKKITSTECYIMKNQKEYENIIRMMKKEVIFFHDRTNGIILENQMRLRELETEDNKIALQMAQLPFQMKQLEFDKLVLDAFLSKSKDEFEFFVNALKAMKQNEKPDEPVKEIPFKSEIQPDEPVVNESSSNVSIEPAEPVVETETKARVNTYAPRVQMYNPLDLTQVVRAFPSITEAVRAVNESSYSQIKIAAQNNTIYMGHRWNLLHCEMEDLQTPVELDPTVEIQTRIVSSIAMLDLEKTRIINVFTKQTDAAKHISQEPSVICMALRYNKPIGGYAWMRLDDVDADIVDVWASAGNEIPGPAPNIKGLRVQQIDSATDAVVNTFASLTDASKTMKMSPNTIKRYVASQTAYNGFLWKFVE